jgi:hypothetical protein
MGIKYQIKKFKDDEIKENLQFYIISNKININQNNRDQTKNKKSLKMMKLRKIYNFINYFK